ncbi:MAG: hypothetical protein ACP5VS_16255, partial [Desulfomonilaceae bacterium]
IHICRKRMIKALDEEICKSKKIVGFDVLEAEEFKNLKFKKAMNSVLPNNFDNGKYNLTKNIANFNVSIEINSFTIAVTLTDFRVDPGKTIDKIFDSKGKLGLSKIVINKGQLIKIVNKRKDGEQKYLLTQKWSDWIDYWAVDFEYDLNQSNQDMNNSTKSTVFESMWRSFRTPKKRSIKLTSAFWTYNYPGNYKIAVQVVDIFGNEMLKIFNVSIC